MNKLQDSDEHFFAVIPFLTKSFWLKQINKTYVRFKWIISIRQVIFQLKMWSLCIWDTNFNSDVSKLTNYINLFYSDNQIQVTKQKEDKQVEWMKKN